MQWSCIPDPWQVARDIPGFVRLSKGNIGRGVRVSEFCKKDGGSVWSNVKLQLQELALSRGERALVAGLSLSLAGGDAIALVGPNGSGKTSLLRVLAGLAEPSGGRLSVSHSDADGDMPRNALVHLGGHQDGLKGALTVRQNLEFWMAYYGGDHLVREGYSIAQALDQLGVGHVIDLPAAILSQGQKRRVALARLLVAPRPVWLLDEPTAALDVASTTRFLALVERHRADGGLVIAATHTPLALNNLITLDLADHPAHTAQGEGIVQDAESYWLTEEAAQ
ncbi:MAG: hypothetical protein Rhims3KO_15580 [Hyphomicrobiales bacterium]